MFMLGCRSNCSPTLLRTTSLLSAGHGLTTSSSAWTTKSTALAALAESVHRMGVAIVTTFQV